ncbi:YihY/virulence factor BrkB family protein [Methylobacter sp. BlB1]|uniref:YihY/virulence factor BrkB family protein n=1 Tax=Methylobacter sp. BlB1 TaxID=2785914 RepID=UPI0018943967|nr:YihY/virulence factor BrkB family protein [Methylobacter sp. BlB1]MBF6650891.1 YihY/virulence factor BrkB family protein [Methylobacter sp. BlB1]
MNLNIIDYFKEDIWVRREQRLSPFKAKVLKFTKVILLSYEGFNRDLGPLRASALTLYSLLAIVPVFALLFGIAKGFGYEKTVKEQLLEQMPSHDTLALKLIDFAENLLASTQGEVVAGIGIIVLFWTVIKLIGHIERSFNRIWKMDKDRALGRKLTDYLSIMLLAPILLVISSGITVFLKTQITWLVDAINLPEMGTWAVLRLLGLLPVVILSALFAFTFIFMPNLKVDYKAGIIAGVVTGVVYQLTQWGYLTLQIGVSSYNAIYGSFAALPLFIIWLQIGWMIVLFGCEISFYLQNYEDYQGKNKVEDLSIFLKKVIALKAAHLIIKNFVAQQDPLSALEIASRLALPAYVIHGALAELMACQIVVQVKTEDDADEVYLPAVDVNQVTVAYVINALERRGQNHLPDIGEDEQFMNVVNEFRQCIENAEQNRLLKDI